MYFDTALNYQSCSPKGTHFFTVLTKDVKAWKKKGKLGKTVFPGCFQFYFPGKIGKKYDVGNMFFYNDK